MKSKMHWMPVMVAAGLALLASRGALATTVTLTDTDIGSVPSPGSASGETLNGSGVDSGTSFAGNFDYVALNGNFDVSVGVSNFSRAPYPFAALLAVNGSTPNQAALLDGMGWSIGGLVGNQYEANSLRQGAVSGGVVNSATGSSFIPWYLRITRTGDTFTNYISNNGASNSWTQVSSYSLAMGTTTDVGLFVDSMGSSSLAMTAFSNLSVTGTLAPTQSQGSGSSGTGVPEPAGLGLLGLAVALGTTLLRRKVLPAD